MKTFKYITSVACMVGALTFASCDFLDKPMEGTVPFDEVDFSAVGDMYKPVSAVYGKYRTGLTHWVIEIESVIRDGDYWSGRINDQTALLDWRQYNYNNGYFGVNEAWTQYYGAIKIANSALETLDSYAEYINDDATRAKYRSYVSEIKTLRALAYYRLVQFFGPVVILRTNTQTDFRRSSVELVYNYMLEDLQYAIDNGMKLRPNEMEHKGAVTAYTAELLAAKIHLQMGNYDKVKELTDDIITSGKFELYEDYTNLFTIKGKLCNESLFEIQCTDMGQGSGTSYDSNSWFAAQGPGAGKAVVAGRSITGWGFVGAYESFRDWAVERGETVRREASFLEAETKKQNGDSIGRSSNAQNTTIWNGKAYTPTDQITAGRTSYGQNNNVRVLRYADAILMNAEANFRLGNTGVALTRVNEIRTRAKLPELSTVTLQDILDERRMELCAEWGDYYDDLCRTGRAAEVLGPNGWTEAKRYLPLPFAQTSAFEILNEAPYEK